MLNSKVKGHTVRTEHLSILSCSVQHFLDFHCIDTTVDINVCFDGSLMLLSRHHSARDNNSRLGLQNLGSLLGLSTLRYSLPNC